MSADLVKAPSRWLEPAKEAPLCECHKLKSDHGWCSVRMDGPKRVFGYVQPGSERCVFHGASERPSTGRFMFDAPLADQGGLSGQLTLVMVDLCQECATETARIVDDLGGRFWEI
jgi:hypothetical protein